MTGKTGIRLLGPFSVTTSEGLAVALASRRAIALLACLAAEPQVAWTRERIAALLWPGRGTDQARASLRQELRRIRKSFSGIAPELWEGPSGLRIPTDRIAVDVVRFRLAASDAKRGREVLALYQGEFLEGFVAEDDPFGKWLGTQRRRLRELALASLLRSLKSSLTDAGEGERAARRVLEIEPSCEEAHRWLIQRHLERGENAEAMAQFASCAEALRLGLSVHPSAETRALMEGLGETAPAPRRGKRRRASEMVDWIKHARETASSPLAPAPEPFTPIESRPSLVVLPFADLSSPPGEDLAFGITEETTSALARVPGFFVTARHSAMAYRNAAIDVRRIAAELGVRYLIEGSVAYDDQRIRVNTRLIDGRTGLHLWSESREHVLSRLMDLRDEIVNEIAGRLQPKLIRAEIRRALSQPPTDLDAWTLLQRAQGLLHFRRREEALSDVIEPLRRAIEADPDFAMAHALLSAVYTWRAILLAFPDRDGDRQRAREHAEAAIATEPDNPFVLIHSAETTLYSNGDIDGTLELLEQAIERTPNDAQGLAMLANVRRFAGADPRSSLTLIGDAMRISPRDRRTYSWRHYANWCYWKLGDLDAMEAAARRSIELYSKFPWSWLSLTCALSLQGRMDAAHASASVMRELMPHVTPDAFFETARRFYGRRFPGAVENGYAELKLALERALKIPNATRRS
jgi:TolB-like protein/DNA-binding SARP family transcriptional activator